MIDPNETLGHIAVAHPAATGVFLRHRLDFCCGGSRKLVDACSAAGIDPKTVIADIATESERSSQKPEQWDSRPLNELIDHILTRFHEPLHKDLGGFVAAAEKVERVHADKASCPRGLAAHLKQINYAVEDHLAKEEQVLFPALRAGARGYDVSPPIQVMMAEHEDHGVNLKRMRELAGDFKVPAEACGTWRGLYEALEKLEADLMEHIHLENNVLFPRALAEAP